MADDVEAIVTEILDALIPTFEAAEARSGAVLQFLKDKGIATQDELAPYLQQAGDASNVRWRAARLRLEHLFSSAIKGAQKAVEKREEADNKTAEENNRKTGSPETHVTQESARAEEESVATASGKKDAGGAEQNEQATSSEDSRKDAA